MRRVIVTSVASALVLLLSWGGLLSASYHRRWQAAKLLELVREFHPGETSETRVRAQVRPFAPYQVDDGYYLFENSPRWLPRQMAFPWTLFMVHFGFDSGILAEIDVKEIQEDQPGYSDPNSVSVSIYSNRLHTAPDIFSGYSEIAQPTSRVNVQGRWVVLRCSDARSIRLDERATSAQRERSLNFQLSCMTSFVRCKDDRQILP
jgi:hypothetical protein